MMKLELVFACVVAIANVWLATSSSVANEFVPIRTYSDRVDSPFSDFGVGDMLRIEDFESAQPMEGVTYSSPHAWEISEGFSVAGDATPDVPGRALEVFGNICATSYPPQCPSTLTVTLDEKTFGQLPTYFGFVWTDAKRASESDVHPWARVNVTDALGNVSGNLINELPLADGLENAAADDTLIGFVNDNGIRQVDISIVTNGMAGGGHFAIDHVQFGVSALSGDADRDGDVDFTDFLTLSDEFGNEGTGWGGGDFNFDTRTGFPDFLRLSKNYGSEHRFANGRRSGGVANVPEPQTSWLWCTSTALAILSVRRRIRRNFLA